LDIESFPLWEASARIWILRSQSSESLVVNRPAASLQGCDGVYLSRLIYVNLIQATGQQIGVDFRKLFSNNGGMAKESQHGGKRPGAGRRPLSAEERRDQIFAVKITKAEKRLLDESDAKTWVRPIIFAAAQKKLAELGKNKKTRKSQ
jgi:hypothetical protein